MPLGIALPGTVDPQTATLVRLFTEVCVPNMGRPSQIRAWASARQLREIDDPPTLETLVGPDRRGEAWAVPTPEGKFALGIRGPAQACFAWAASAVPQEVEGAFRQIMRGVERPGLVITEQANKTVVTPGGPARVLAYDVSRADSPQSFVFVMTTAKHGETFQASISVALAGPTSVH